VPVSIEKTNILRADHHHHGGLESRATHFVFCKTPNFMAAEYRCRSKAHKTIALYELP
jgi:hypothetical protein